MHVNSYIILLHFLNVICVFGFALGLSLDWLLFVYTSVEVAAGEF